MNETDEAIDCRDLQISSNLIVTQYVSKPPRHRTQIDVKLRDCSLTLTMNRGCYVTPKVLERLRVIIFGRKSDNEKFNDLVWELLNLNRQSTHPTCFFQISGSDLRRLHLFGDLCGTDFVGLRSQTGRGAPEESEIMDPGWLAFHRPQAWSDVCRQGQP